MEKNDKELEVTLNEKSLEILVTKFIPTSQYFERSFEMLQRQMDGFREGQRDLKSDIHKRFEQVDKRFEHVDKRFEQVDKRFEQVTQGQKEIRIEMNKRFEQVNTKLDTIIERMDVKLDAGLRETRTMSIRLFSFAMIFSAISMSGFLANMTGLF